MCARRGTRRSTHTLAGACEPEEARARLDLGNDAISRLLLDRGADPNWPETGAPRGAALHIAACDGDRPMVELLLDQGAGPNGSIDSSGSATYAARTPDLRALLMSRGGHLDAYDLVWLDEDDEVVRRVTADPRAEAGGGQGRGRSSRGALRGHASSRRASTGSIASAKSWWARGLGCPSSSKRSSGASGSA